MAETRSDKGSLIFGGIVALLLGAGLFFVCYSVLDETGQCGRETMRASDTCEHRSNPNGGGRVYSAAEEDADKRSTAWWTGGLGTLFVVLGGAGIVGGLRSTDDAAGTESSTRSATSNPRPDPNAPRYTDLGEALAALASGEVLTFGHLRLDARQLHTTKNTLAWSDITEVKLEPHFIAFFRRGKWTPIVTKASDVPHLPLVASLVEHLRKQST
ncbi:DUF6585 family protein [Nocardia yamanashiensis]|uniref:DUF6585 family protein n=1 Tax=Nocardia yamanashiensis TaxID=209247 RepID=UPI000AFDFB9C|nr:DUF6585 family protein [Nocardia yamanashiensis]